jgi:cellulose synthase/poly-beta-1,6-N-acetylglucosamine synthase-like glycosyltransferase
VPSGRLPTYTVLVPLYREAAVVPDLLAHLGKLDYPASKLQVLLLLEADDVQTREAVIRQAGLPGLEIVIVPPGDPRTKPKALVYALPFARGEFVVVFDAEDRPELDQLRKAAAAFQEAPDLGCVQARLTPDHEGSWFARMFKLEYAATFEVLLPALADAGVPLPLGGTSNHFPRAVLQRVGAWDPYNVTEDADLGIRLARFGLRTATIFSRTYEEAPLKLRQWLPQRRRWIKGWMQTALLCAAGPVPAGLRLGLRDRLAVHGIISAGVVGLLLYPASLATMLFGVVALIRDGPPNDIWMALFLALNANLLVIVAAAAISTFRGLRALGALRLAPMILFLPIYWAFMAVAAWQALCQLFRDLPARNHWKQIGFGLVS